VGGCHGRKDTIREVSGMGYVLLKVSRKRSEIVRE
jgi:hypothetical protein